MNLGNAYRGKLELAKAKAEYERCSRSSPPWPTPTSTSPSSTWTRTCRAWTPSSATRRPSPTSTSYKEKGGTDDRVEQYLKDANKGIDEEERRREREKKDQLRKAEQLREAEAAAPSAPPQRQPVATRPSPAEAPASDTSGAPPAQTSKKKSSRAKLKTP